MKIAIIGSNDLAQLIANYAVVDKSWEIVGFFDNKKPVQTQIMNFGNVLGNINDIEKFYNGKTFDKLLIGVGYNQFNFRISVFNKLKNKIPFANLIHSNSYLNDSCILGEGIIILPGCTIDRNVVISDNVFFNIGCSIAHDSNIGQHCFFAPNVTLSGKVNLGHSNFLGAGSIISDNTFITNRCLIGAGSLVLKNIKDEGCYYGIPAKKNGINKFLL